MKEKKKAFCNFCQIVSPLEGWRLFCRSIYLVVLSFLPYKLMIYECLFSHIFISCVLGRSIRPGLWQDFLEARLAWVKWHRRMWVWRLVMPFKSSLCWVLCFTLRKWTWHSGLVLFFRDSLDQYCSVEIGQESQMWTTYIILHFLAAPFMKENEVGEMFHLMCNLVIIWIWMINI